MSNLTQDINIYRKIPLNFPFKDGEGKEVRELNLRRAKVADMKRMNSLNGSDAEKEIYMLALLTGFVPEDLDQMDISDYSAVQKALMDMQKGK